jgi:hypothetical protein
MMEWMGVRLYEYMYVCLTREIGHEHRILLGKQIGKWIWKAENWMQE